MQTQQLKPGLTGPTRARMRSPGSWLGAVVLLAGATAPGETALAAIPPVSDPEYLIATWETEDGLPENSATAMAQTPDGYLWFGTFNGLVRFDGVRFQTLTPANTPGLPSAAIVNLHTDRRGRLWVSTDRGLGVWGDRLWRHWGPEQGWKGGYVRTFAERANGDLLFTTFDGHVLQLEGERLTALPEPPGQAGHGYFGHADPSGCWWVAQNRFVGSWDGERWTEAVSLEEPVADAVGAGTARNGGLLLVVRQELRRLHGTAAAMRLRLSEPFYGGIWTVAEDRRGNVWVSTYNRGIARIGPDGTVRRWTTANGLSSNNSRFVFEDREGSLWVGTSGGGLMRFTPRRLHVVGPEQGLSERNVRAVAPGAEGRLWMATYGGGLFRWQEGRAQPVPLPGFVSSTIYGQSVIEARGGHVWFGTYARGGWRVGPEGAFALPVEHTGGKTITAWFEDSRGRVWAGGDDALACFEDRMPRPLAPDLASRLRGAVALEEDSSGGLWVSNLEAVFRLEQDRATEIVPKSKVPLQGVLCFLPGADGSVWMGSRDEGLWRWVPGDLRRLGPSAGLPRLEIRSLLDDGLGWLWMSAERSIVRVLRSDLEAAFAGSTNRVPHLVLDARDGLPGAHSPAGVQPVAARDSHGRLWFATLKGAAVVDPTTFPSNPEPPPVLVEEIRFLSDVSDAGDPATAAPPSRLVRWVPPFASPLRLPPATHGLHIRYTALSFVAPEKVRFEVKLEGRDPDWQEPETPRVAYLDELPPRDYVFRVRAANNDGVWNPVEASLAFTVLPHLWQTWWFQGGLGLGLAALGATGATWASRARVRRALERAKTAHTLRTLAGRLIHAQEDERRRLARELHDDFSQRLALLSVELDLLDPPDGDAAPGQGPRLAGLASQVKELSSDVHRLAYELHPAKLDQLGLVAAGQAFCRELARQSGLHISFEAGGFPRDVPPDVALCLYRILQEALQNTVRHSGAQEAQVELRAGSDRARLVVSDAGRGFDVERGRRKGGLGLSSMQERVRHLNGSLSVRSHPGQGTRIEVCVPWPGATFPDECAQAP